MLLLRRRHNQVDVFHRSRQQEQRRRLQ